MAGELVLFDHFENALPLKDIEIAPENVRKRAVETDLESLKESIKEVGLIHPVIVLPEKDGKYQLIVGQRRFRAFTELKRDKIPALVLGHDLGSEDRKRVSFAENNQRRRLPYKDTIALCNALFGRAKGNTSQKVKNVALELGISEGTVLKYLSFWLVPEPVQDLVERRLLTRGEAYRITVAFWPSTRRILEMARSATKLNKDERDRLVAIGSKLSGATTDEIVAQAKKPYPIAQVVIYLDPETLKVLGDEATRRATDVRTLVQSIVEDWATEERRDED
jgi:ParB family chromosome partitioning protein